MLSLSLLRFSWKIVYLLFKNPAEWCLLNIRIPFLCYALCRGEHATVTFQDGPRRNSSLCACNVPFSPSRVAFRGPAPLSALACTASFTYTSQPTPPDMLTDLNSSPPLTVFSPQSLRGPNFYNSVPRLDQGFPRWPQALILSRSIMWHLGYTALHITYAYACNMYPVSSGTLDFPKTRSCNFL